MWWTLNYLADIESDLSVFHRVDDMWSMPARRWCDLVLRLSAYRGVLRARAEDEAAAREQSGQPVAAAGSTARLDAASDPALADVIEVVKVNA